MKLLVTGGAGYIGSVVAAKLIETGHEVTIFDNMLRGHMRAVPEGARLVMGDLLNRDELDEIIGEGSYDGVLHFAALTLVGESVQQPNRYFRVNVGGTLNLLEAMEAHGVGRIVFSSSAAVYGEPEEVPIPETAPTRPTNPYGASKLAVDQLLTYNARAHDLAAVSLRYFNVAGAYERYGEDHHPETHIIPIVLSVALGERKSVQVYGDDYPTRDGTAVRDYIHIEDLARAHLLALEAAQPGEHKVYNLGNGAGYSVLEVIDTARRVTGHEIPAEMAPRRPGDPAVLVASSRKIHDELGWTPEKPAIGTIVADAWRWHQSHPHGYGEP